MEVFVDTSALLAVLDAADSSHKRAERIWRRLLGSDDRLVSTNYISVETFAVAQRRLGLDAVRTLDRYVFPLIDIVWVDSELHHRAAAALFVASRRSLSLVDCVSFEVMRSRGLTTTFAFDRDFSAQGFATIP